MKRMGMASGRVGLVAGHGRGRGDLGDVRGAVLLEVVLALVLFVGAAAIIGAGLGSAVDSVERQRLNIHAANLASTVLAELQLGARGTEAGPEAFPAPFERWSWEIQISPVETELGESSGLSLAEVIVRHDDPPVVHRLAEVIRPKAGGARRAATGAGVAGSASSSWSSGLDLGGLR